MLLLALVSVAYWVVIATLTSRDNIDRLNELYDVHLARTAKAFLQLIDPDPEAVQTTTLVLKPTEIDLLLNGTPASLEPVGTTHLPYTPVGSQDNHAATQRLQYGTHLHYQLWRESGNLLAMSAGAPSTLMTQQLGYSDSIDAQGQTWRHYSFHDAAHQARVVVSEPSAFRQALVRHIVVDATLPLALGLPILLGLLWLSIRRGLRPLADLGAEIARRQSDTLTLLPVEQTPTEAKPIVLALNGLLQRLAHTLEQERRFTDDAAHQLRTPLAAIQAQLYAVRHLQDPQQRGEATHRLQDSVARAIRLVNQMLALARLDPEQPAPNFTEVSFGDIAESVCADLAPAALQRDQTLELSVQPGLSSLRGNPDMLSMLLTNLVDNAIHYTPRGGQIRVQAEQDGAAVALLVSDNGPGIAAHERSRVFERFYRVAAQSEPGTGLGLAICRRIAELHHTQLELGDGLHGQGLSVCVRFAL